MGTFHHAADLRADHRELVAGVLFAAGISPQAEVGDDVRRWTAAAARRLEGGPESTFPEIQAWRRVFSGMGLKPTQYRCASEALLRRLRSDGIVPPIHPLVDLANAVSMAFALPIAAFDLDRVAGGLEVRHASGQERYETFGGEVEHPEPGEVVFADDDGWAHARRWTNRQSGRSAVRAATSRVLVVIEGVHETAADEVPRALETVAGGIATAWGPRPRTSMLSAARPGFDW